MSEQARKVLVTAAESSIGQAVIAALSADPAVDRVLAVHGPGGAPPVDSGRVHHVATDITRARAMRELLFSEAARDLGAIVYVPPPSQDPSHHAEQAVPLASVTERLLHAAEEHAHLARFVMVSTAEVYRITTREPTLIDEDHPLELSADAEPALRERVQSDLVACARIGLGKLRVTVLRCSQILASDASGRLLDYLSSRVCLRPLGYDPMLNVLALEDAAEAVRLALQADADGIFNIPGRDSLPLSELIHATGRIGIGVPGPALHPLYALRSLTTAFRFRYAPQRRIFHLGTVLDGRKAHRALGYAPVHGVRLRAHEGRSR